MINSIVIPTYNRAALVTRAIDSALAQTVPCEVVVCDHGSTDETPDVVRAYGPTVRYVRREEDFGPHFCFLDGVMQSTGEFTTLLIDDDWLGPRFVEACNTVFTPDMGMCFTKSQLVDGVSGQNLNIIHGNGFQQTGAYRTRSVERHLLRTIITPAAAVYRRQIMLDALTMGRLPLQQHEYFGVGPDRLMTLLSMLRYREVGFVDEPLSFLSAHQDSITVQAHGDPKTLDAMMDAYQECDDFYKMMKRARLRHDLLWLLRQTRRRMFGWRKPRA